MWKNAAEYELGFSINTTKGQNWAKVDYTLLAIKQRLELKVVLLPWADDIDVWTKGVSWYLERLQFPVPHVEDILPGLASTQPVTFEL